MELRKSQMNAAAQRQAPAHAISAPQRRRSNSRSNGRNGNMAAANAQVSRNKQQRMKRLEEFLETRPDATLAEMADAVSSFALLSGGAERQLVVLSGRFVHSSTETYFLATDNGVGSLPELASRALPLSVVLLFLCFLAIVNSVF